MSVIFGNVSSVYSILDDVNEEDDFFIEEIRFCSCFFDEFQYLIRKNNFKIGFNENKNQVFEKVEYCCLYYRFKLLSDENIFNCICRNCQITLLKLVSKTLNSVNLTKNEIV